MEHVIEEMVENFERGKLNRRQLIQGLALAATAASAAKIGLAEVGAKPMQVTYLNHVGFHVPDYKKTRDWYEDVFGLKGVLDDGNHAAVAAGEAWIYFHPKQSPEDPPIEHISLTIEGWDTDKNVRPAVLADIKRRGIELIKETPCCVHIRDLNGFELQLGGKSQ